MAHGPKLVAFIPSRHLGRSHAFYGGQLGLNCTEATPQANEYDAHGAALRVTLVVDQPPSPHTVLGWRVSHLPTAMAELGERGIQFKRYDGFDQDEEGIWTAPGGSRIAWFEDPDANIISLQQPPPR